jgi:hypothetical protein
MGQVSAKLRRTERGYSHCCHYFLHAGVLKFCGDSKHALAGKEVALPDHPSHLRDDEL